VTVTYEDGQGVYSGTLVDGLFDGAITRALELNNGLVLRDELVASMGIVPNSGRQTYGMPPWTRGEE
jgi:hypothetical protein